MEFDINNLTSIYEYLYLSELDSFVLNELTNYVNAYNDVLNSYLNSPSPDEELSNKLEKLTQPINFIDTNFPYMDENAVLPPAVEFIRSKINKTRQTDKPVEQEKEYTRVRTPEESRINGFANYFIVLVLTAILGIMLGALLYFIQN